MSVQVHVALPWERRSSSSDPVTVTSTHLHSRLCWLLKWLAVDPSLEHSVLSTSTKASGAAFSSTQTLKYIISQGSVRDLFFSLSSFFLDNLINFHGLRANFVLMLLKRISSSKPAFTAGCFMCRREISLIPQSGCAQILCLLFLCLLSSACVVFSTFYFLVAFSFSMCRH